MWAGCEGKLDSETAMSGLSLQVNNPAQHNFTSNIMNTQSTLSPANLLNKVPQVALSFWVVKVLSTTVGETGADFLAVVQVVKQLHAQLAGVLNAR